jgi:hypothetical protein
MKLVNTQVEIKVRCAVLVEIHLQANLATH